MRVRIHFEHKDGTEDSFIVVGDDNEAIRNKADAELKKRGIDMGTAWSEDV